MSRKAKRKALWVKGDLDRRVYNLLPENGAEMQAKDIYKKGKAEEISKISIQRKLKELSEDGLLIHRDAGHKQVYYSRLENVRIQRLISNFTQEIQETFSKLPEGMSLMAQGTANLIAEDYRKTKGEDLPAEAKEALMRNPIFLEEMGFLSFVEAVFRVFKAMLHTKVATTEDFFINKYGEIVPSAEIYKRFKPSEIEEWNKISSSDK